MTAFPGHCVHCNSLFTVDNALSFENSEDVLINRLSVKCPKCNKNADLIDGRFDFKDGRIIVKDAPLRSILIIAAIVAARQIQNDHVDEAELLSPLKAMPEKLGKLFENRFRTGGIHKYSAFLVIALGCLISNTKINATLDINVLFDQIRTAVTQAEPYPGLTHSSEASALPSNKAEPRAEQTPKLNPSKRQRRRQQGQAKMQQKQTSKSPSPKKKR